MLVLYGGTGFIGRHICEGATRQDVDLGVISRSPKMDFLNRLSGKVSVGRVGGADAEDLLQRAKTVVYLANTTKPSSIFKTVTDIVTEDLRAVTGFMEKLHTINPKCRFIYLSSGGQIYGPDYRSLLLENNALNPVTPYALSKLLNENALNYFQSTHQGSITILRLANPIGHWQVGTSHGLVSAAITAAIAGNTLTIYGKGENARDYFDVDDFSDFICRLHEAGNIPSGTFNIGSQIANTEQDVISVIEKTLNVSLNVNFEPAREFDFPYAVLDSSKAKKELGWQAITPLQDSIKKIAKAVEYKLENQS